MKLCDLSVLVDIDRGGVDRRVTKLDEEGTHAISIVTVTELRLGVEFQYDRDSDAYDDACEKLDRLLSRFEIIHVDRPIAIAAADIIASLRVAGERLDDLHDLYIAATAKVRELPVLTSNVDGFERFDTLRVVDWDEY